MDQWSFFYFFVKVVSNVMLHLLGEEEEEDKKGEELDVEAFSGLGENSGGGGVTATAPLW